MILNGLGFDYSKSGNLDDAAVKNLPSANRKPSLLDMVNDLQWDVVIQPGARQVFSLPISALPKAHVLELPHDIDDHMGAPACHDLAKAEVPSMADHFLIEALRQRNTANEDADFAIIPYYQGCYYNYLKQNTFKKLAETVAHAETQITFNDRLRASNIVVPVLHDWGSVSLC